jgi:hypothetical protein
MSERTKDSARTVALLNYRYDACKLNWKHSMKKIYMLFFLIFIFCNRTNVFAQMTLVIFYNQCNKHIYYSCGNFDTCYREWFLGSSDSENAVTLRTTTLSPWTLIVHIAVLQTTAINRLSPWTKTCTRTYNKCTNLHCLLLY